MKPSYILTLLAFALIHNVQTQSFSDKNPSGVAQLLKDKLASMDKYHFKGEMRFKEFGGDTFDIRNFEISFRSNPANPLYGYDFEVAERVDSGYTFSLMILPEALYIMYDGSKIISRRPLPEQIDLGSLLEFLRSYFILDEIFYPFIDHPVTVVDSNNFIYLTRQMNDWATRLLVVDKQTYLPVRSLSTIRNHEFDLTQLTEINFYFDSTYHQLPEKVINPDFYISSGFTLKVVEEKANTTISIEKNTLSHEQQEFLLSHPFISATGDTTIIGSSEAGYILLDFWYASCIPCLKAIPEINQLAKNYAEEGLVVIGVNCFDLGIMENVTAKLRAKNVTFPLLFGTRKVVETLEIFSFPTYLLITPERNVEVIDEVGEVKEKLKSVLGPLPVKKGNK